MAAKSKPDPSPPRPRFAARPIVLICAALVLIGIAYGGISAYRSRAAASTAACCKTGGTAGNLTLNPALFVGPVRDAYRVARDNPALLAQLHCYCGCDRALNHHSLLDCYRDKHGSTCEICVGEAIEANKLFNQGTPVDQIRDALRQRFSNGG